MFCYRCDKPHSLIKKKEGSFYEKTRIPWAIVRFCIGVCNWWTLVDLDTDKISKKQQITSLIIYRPFDC